MGLMRSVMFDDLAKTRKASTAWLNALVRVGIGWSCIWNQLPALGKLESEKFPAIQRD
jgi:hypothetical protein